MFEEANRGGARSRRQRRPTEPPQPGTEPVTTRDALLALHRIAGFPQPVDVAPNCSAGDVS